MPKREREFILKGYWRRSTYLRAVTIVKMSRRSTKSIDTFKKKPKILLSQIMPTPLSADSLNSNSPQFLVKCEPNFVPLGRSAVAPTFLV